MEADGSSLATDAWAHDAFRIETVALRYRGRCAHPACMSSRNLCMSPHTAETARGFSGDGQRDFVCPDHALRSAHQAIGFLAT